MDIDITSQEFLQNFLEREYNPSFLNVTRPSNTKSDRIGTCIDIRFIKNKTVNTKTYKIKNLFTDPLFLNIDKMN